MRECIMPIKQPQTKNCMTKKPFFELGTVRLNPFNSSPIFAFPDVRQVSKIYRDQLSMQNSLAFLVNLLCPFFFLFSLLHHRVKLDCECSFSLSQYLYRRVELESELCCKEVTGSNPYCSQVLFVQAELQNLQICLIGYPKRWNVATFLLAFWYKVNKPPQQMGLPCDCS